MNLETLKFNVSEIFYSIQGEGSRAGLPCLFVRLQGCMLRCSWCDTPYALDIRQKEHEMTGSGIIDEIMEYKCRFIMFTGGEPLQQKDVIHLIKYLCEQDYTVAIETNGHVHTGDIDSRAIKILDLKCPGSGMNKFNNYDNLNILNRHDEIKFVIKDDNDYEWAKEKIIEYSLYDKVDTILMSPVFGIMEPVRLAKLILRDSLPVRLQLQMHKFIWEPETRGV